MTIKQKNLIWVFIQTTEEAIALKDGKVELDHEQYEIFYENGNLLGVFIKHINFTKLCGMVYAK